MVGTPRATIHGKFGLIKMVSPKKLWICHCQLYLQISDGKAITMNKKLPFKDKTQQL